MKYKILVLYFHPSHHASRVNRRMKEAIAGLSGVTVHDVYEAYPNLFVNINAEKKLLLEHDVIVFQHPFYWYSCPPLMKAWEDEVLELGWAYGDRGTALKGKHWLQVISTGGPEESYHRKGRNHFTTAELLRPFEQTAYLCGMVPLQPFIVHSARNVTEENLAQCCAEYRALLEGMVMGRLPPAMTTLKSDEVKGDHP